MNNLKKEIIIKIKEQFSLKQTFTRKELYDLLASNFYPNLKETTFRWRIYDLKQSNVIVSISRRIFKRSDKKNIFVPVLDKKIIEISNLIQQNFRLINYCLWNSKWLNEFSRHQAMNEIIFVEVEKDLIKSVFNLLLDNNYNNVYIQPDKFISETYISENQSSVIVKSLITKSPIKNVNNSSVPKLEKILVDLFSERNYLVAYKGYEQKNIFENAIDTFQLNFSTLINYSRRRKKDKLIKEYLIKEINIKKDIFE